MLTRWCLHVPGGFHGRRRPCRGRREPPAGSERWGREAGAGASVALKCRWLLSAWDAGGPLLFKVTLISDFYRVTYERAQIQFECDICERSSCVCKPQFAAVTEPAVSRSACGLCTVAPPGPPLLLGVGHMRCDLHRGPCPCGLPKGLTADPQRLLSAVAMSAGSATVSGRRAVESAWTPLARRCDFPRRFIPL